MIKPRYSAIEKVENAQSAIWYFRNDRTPTSAFDHFENTEKIITSRCGEVRTTLRGLAFSRVLQTPTVLLQSDNSVYLFLVGKNWIENGTNVFSLKIK